MTEKTKRFSINFRRGDDHWQVEGTHGQTLYSIARDNQIPIETDCNGVGACIRCKVKILDGQLSKPLGLERDRIGNIFHITGERLACQAKIEGEATVEIPVPRPSKRSRRRSRAIKS